MSAMVWPCSILNPRNRQVDPVYRSVSGGVALNGFTQVIASDAGIWKAVFAQIFIRNPSQIKAWRAIRAHAEGRLNPILISLCEGAIRPLQEPGQRPFPPVPHSDDAFFEDETGYRNGMISVRLSHGAALRSTVLMLNKIACGSLEPGQRFSLGERLYEIRKVFSQNASQAEVAVWPPLREAVGAGTDANFDRPVLRVRLATDGEMDLMLDLNRFASPTVNFLEDMAS